MFARGKVHARRGLVIGVGVLFGATMSARGVLGEALFRELELECVTKVAVVGMGHLLHVELFLL